MEKVCIEIMYVNIECCIAFPEKRNWYAWKPIYYKLLETCPSVLGCAKVVKSLGRERWCLF
jgi:hypothetical protein